MIVQHIKNQEQPITGTNSGSPSLPLGPSSYSGSAILPLVECMMDENNILKSQINHIEAEIHKSRCLSNGLLKENQSLRQLYKERTEDIVKLIKSISINTDQDIADYQHQCHLLQELNFSTLKQIKILDRQRTEAELRLQQKLMQDDQLSERKNQLEHDGLNKLKARLSNGLSPQAAEALKKKYNLENEQIGALGQEVDGLIVLNKKLSRSIVQMKRTEQPQIQLIANEKGEYERKIVYLKEQNKRYRQELATDRVELERTQEQRQTKEERFNQVTQSTTEEVRRYEHYQRLQAQVNSNIESIRSKIGLSNRNQSNLNAQLEQLRYLRKEKQEQTKKQVKSKAMKAEQIRMKEQTHIQDNRDKIVGLRNLISRSQAANQEQRNKIVNEKKEMESSIASLQSYHRSLEEQIEEYKKVIKEYPNPIGEIERIQLILRLKKTK